METMLLAILTVVNWVIYHKIFVVYYFGGVGNGIFREIFYCLIAATIELALLLTLGQGILSIIFTLGQWLLGLILIIAIIILVVYLVYKIKKVLKEKTTNEDEIIEQRKNQDDNIFKKNTKTEMRYCVYCGKQISKTENFCIYCGKPTN